jgi:hypothetical protein
MESDTDEPGGKVNKFEVLEVWCRVALSREFVSSCRFEDATVIADEADSGSVSSGATSTIRARIRQSHRGSIIMPFRSDTAECLFLS